MRLYLLSALLIQNSVALADRVRSRRVANGTKVEQRVDFMVSLESKPYWFFMPFEHVCGGVIISSFWVLSAAHCFFGRRSIDAIGYGSNDRQKLRHFEIEFTVIPEGFQEKFNASCKCAFDEDLAAIKSKQLLPVSSLDNLPTLERFQLKPFRKTKLFAWGQMETGKYAECLREATLVIVSGYAAFTYNKKSLFGYSPKGQKSLAGDSGSPWTSLSRGKLYGIHVGAIDDVAVSVSMAYYANWIMYVMYEYKELFRARKSAIVRCCSQMNATVYQHRRYV